MLQTAHNMRKSRIFIHALTTALIRGAQAWDFPLMGNHSCLPLMGNHFPLMDYPIIENKFPLMGNKNESPLLGNELEIILFPLMGNYFPLKGNKKEFLLMRTDFPLMGNYSIFH